MNTQQTLDERAGWTSASYADADLRCPGRFQACKGLPETTSPDAEFGRVIHAALATGDPSALDVEQRDLFDRCKEIEANGVAELFGEELDKAKVWREQRYWVRVPQSEIRHSGQADVVYRLGSRAVVIDYKTGRNEAPESARNLQLRDLACLVRGNLIGVTDVGTGIIQPLVSAKIEFCLYAEADLIRAEREMFARVQLSHLPCAVRVPGEVQCKFCRAEPSCSEYQKWAGAMVPLMLNLLDVPASAWTPEQQAMFLTREPVAQKWLDDAHALIKDAMLAGSAVPGYGLKPGNKVRTVTDPQACYDRFAAKGGTLKQFMLGVKVQIAKVREGLQAATGLRGKALDGALAQLLQGIVEEKQNQPSIVPTEPESKVKP
jgi:hypothetical protein